MCGNSWNFWTPCLLCLCTGSSPNLTDIKVVAICFGPNVSTVYVSAIGSIRFPNEERPSYDISKFDVKLMEHPVYIYIWFHYSNYHYVIYCVCPISARLYEISKVSYVQHVSHSLHRRIRTLFNYTAKLLATFLNTKNLNITSLKVIILVIWLMNI